MTVKTFEKRQVTDITDQVQNAVNGAGIENGLCAVTVLHTTAAVTTADLDPGTDLDFLDFLEGITPMVRWRHPHAPDHAPDHLLASLIGPTVLLPVADGRLKLGTWQRIVLVEFDGPRDRSVNITVIPAR